MTRPVRRGGDHFPPGWSPPRVRVSARWKGQSAWLLLPALMGALVAVVTSGPLVDPDAYWHVLLGQDIWREHRFTGNPDWTTGPHEPWVTTQWLSEVIMAAVHHGWGWAGLTVLRLTAALGTLAALAVTTVRGQRVAPGAVVFVLAAVCVAEAAQERPASFVLPLVVLLGWAALRNLTDGWGPPWWAVAAVTVLWVNLHGTWVLVPVTAAALILVRLVTGLRPVRPLLATMVVALTAAVLSPAGWYVYRAPFTVRDAAQAISEWQPSSIAADSFVALLVMAALVALAGTAGRARLPVPHVLWVLGCVGFGTLAFRNLVVAALLSAPTAAHLLTMAWPWPDRRSTRATRAAVAALVCLAPVMGGVHAFARGGLAPETPVRVVASVAAQPGPRTVLADYNLTGQVLALSRPGVRVPLDGRTDRYGAARIRDYLDLDEARPGWQSTLARINPTDAVLLTDSPLQDALRRCGWTEQFRSGRVVHLTPPDADTGCGAPVMPVPD